MVQCNCLPNLQSVSNLLILFIGNLRSHCICIRICEQSSVQIEKLLLNIGDGNAGCCRWLCWCNLSKPWIQLLAIFNYFSSVLNLSLRIWKMKTCRCCCTEKHHKTQASAGLVRRFWRFQWAMKLHLVLLSAYQMCWRQETSNIWLNFSMQVFPRVIYTTEPKQGQEEARIFQSLCIKAEISAD